jgi:hypothetical protein
MSQLLRERKTATCDRCGAEEDRGKAWTRLVSGGGGWWLKQEGENRFSLATELGVEALCAKCLGELREEIECRRKLVA